jgi:peptidoglycan/xylan/chitin deacetylase (PgdA/CDA1 family)
MRIPILLFFDDGVREDLIVAELLAKRKLKAVFSIPLRSIGTHLYKEDILKLASVGEIASHGITHMNLVRLVKVSPSLVRREVLYSKIYLEKLVEKPVYTFTYPYGAYNTIVKRLVKEAGYLFARTMNPFNTSLQNVAIHRYEVPITLSDGVFNKYQITRAILNFDVRASFSFWLFKEAFRLNITNSSRKNYWLELILQLLRRIVTDFNRHKNKDLFIILVFHSKEIFNDKDQLNLFKEILDLIANNFSIFEFLTMQDLISRLK